MPPQIHEGAVISVSFLSFAFVALYDEINSVSFLFSATVALYDRIIIGGNSPTPSLYAGIKFLSTGIYWFSTHVPYAGTTSGGFIALGFGLGHFNLMAYFARSIAASFSSFDVISVKMCAILKNVAIVSMVGVSIITLHNESDFII